MQRVLLVKVMVIALLSLLLLIPLSMIAGKVSERSHYRDEVKNDIAESWTGAQRLIGPVLVFPYERTTQVKIWDKNLEQYVFVPQTELHRKFILPEQLNIDGRMDTELRSRGIYSVPVYTATLSLSGHFKPAKEIDEKQLHGQIKWLQPFIALGISDMRGVTGRLQVEAASAGLTPIPGSGIQSLPSGLRVIAGDHIKHSDATAAFDIQLELRGTDRLEFAPMGVSTEISMQSAWPDPKFIGRFLPQQRAIDAGGFVANWSTSHLATGINESFQECVELPEHCYVFNQMSFGVELMQSVDVYHKTERAVKYGLLFVVLVFAVFFLFEILKTLRIHPIQYLLVGLALALFYQLLLSLTELISFASAYWLSTVVAVAIVTFYVSYVLKGFGRASLLGAMLAAIYGMLYVILLSEDHALLMGTILLLTILSTFMFLTRKLDWYKVGEQIARMGAQDSTK